MGVVCFDTHVAPSGAWTGIGLSLLYTYRPSGASEFGLGSSPTGGMLERKVKSLTGGETLPLRENRCVI